MNKLAARELNNNERKCMQMGPVRVDRVHFGFSATEQGWNCRREGVEPPVYVYRRSLLSENHQLQIQIPVQNFTHFDI